MSSLNKKIEKNKYKILAEISSGPNGTILLANEGESLRVIKLLQLKTDFLKKSFKEEMKIEKKIQGHPHIIFNHSRYIIKYRKMKYGVIVMEKMDGDLMDYMLLRGSLEENEAKKLFTQICLAIFHLHENNIVHLDIKPDNLLISKSEEGKIETIKVCDFGFAQKMDSKITETFGTEKYLPPECIDQNFRFNSQISLDKIDVWALGVTLFCILTGYYPYCRKNGIYKKNNLDVINKHCVDDHCCNLIKWMLQENPKDRPTLKEILNHPWINSSPLIVTSVKSMQNDDQNSFFLRTKKLLKF